MILNKVNIKLFVVHDNIKSNLLKKNFQPRIKRAITRDLLFVLGKDENYKKSELLYRAYIK